MKKDSAEGAAVAGIVQHLALSHPEVSFKLLRDGAEVLHTPGDGQLLSAVYAAMGRDFAMGLQEVRGCGGDVQVAGYVTRPLNGHGTRGRQLFFVNGRFVKSQLLSAALEEAWMIALSTMSTVPFGSTIRLAEVMSLTAPNLSQRKQNGS